MSNIYHKHHIVPRHMGGTDDPSNLIKLTVEEHADAHKKLYEQYGKEEDRIAWLTLSGQATKPESMKLASKLGRRKTDNILEEKYGAEWRYVLAKKGSLLGGQRTKQLYETNIEFRNKMMIAQKAGVKKALGDSSKNKRKESFIKNKHQQGTKNSNYGKMWISNLELGVSKTHPKETPIPIGWQKGRKMNW